MKTTRTKTIHKRINTGHLIVHLALLAGIVVVVFPFLWMLLTSFKTTGESLKIPPTFFPEKWTLEAYKTITSSTIPFGTVYLNTIPALFLPNLFSAFGTFLLRQFFMSMPQELEDAAIVDGCNRFQIFGRIMVPLIQPGIAALTIFTFKFAWNDFMWPLIVNNSMDKLILGPALSTLQGQYTTQYPMQMAGAVLAVIPLVVIFFIFQKQFIESVATSGIKG